MKSLLLGLIFYLAAIALSPAVVASWLEKDELKECIEQYVLPAKTEHTAMLLNNFCNSLYDNEVRKYSEAIASCSIKNGLAKVETQLASNLIVSSCVREAKEYEKCWLEKKNTLRFNKKNQGYDILNSISLKWIKLENSDVFYTVSCEPRIWNQAYSKFEKQ